MVLSTVLEDQTRVPQDVHHFCRCISQICEELGWRGKGGMFDVLPLVLQVNGTNVEWFDIPTELILEVRLSHPRLVIRIKSQ